MDFSDIELGPKMQACNERERKFVWFYITNEGVPNAAQAARDAGYADSSDAAKVRGSELMHRDRVLAALEEVGRKAFRGLLGPAVKAAALLIQNERHADHSKAVFTTLARLGLGEKSTLDVNVSGEIQHNHTDAALNDLRTLLGLGVAREKLVEIFGFSGLSRYEKMLAEVDLKRIAGPVVDAEFSEIKQGETE
jgi:hypothetical protein